MTISMMTMMMAMLMVTWGVKQQWRLSGRRLRSAHISRSTRFPADIWRSLAGSMREIFPFPTRNISPQKTTNLECPFMVPESKGVSWVAAKNVLHTVPGGLFFTTNDDTSKVMIYHLTRKRLLERARNCKRISNWSSITFEKRLLKRDIRRSSPIYSRQRPSSDNISAVIFELCYLILFMNREGLSSFAMHFVL